MRTLAVLGVVLALLGGCGETKLGDLIVVPVGLLGNRQQILRGQTLFKAHCSECHGSIAEGRTQRAARLNPAAPDFHESRYRKARSGYLFLRIEQGNRLEPFRSRGSVMPSWEPYLSRDQRWALVAYIHYRADNIPLK
ncbi:MAG: cytochrome c [Geopsychrobacter sp.]|nr:cytochrome c [Geopsychrobacter sp.]